jgi:heme oxygenase
MTSWERKGRQEGWQEGQLALVKRLLKRRLGDLSPAAMKQLSTLRTEQLEHLAEALLDFSTAGDLEKWLARRRRPVNA